MVRELEEKEDRRAKMKYTGYVSKQTIKEKIDELRKYGEKRGEFTVTLAELVLLELLNGPDEIEV